MNAEDKINYHLYIDECGDQNLETFSPTFPIFTLCGILVRDDLVSKLEGQVRALKHEFWGDRQIVLHSRDIRKCQNGFAIVERRGKREDKTLMSYYQQLLGKGTFWVTSERMKSRMNCLDFKWKSEDIAGLQVADLIAYPLTRHVLNPQAVNLAYDVLAPNIFMEDGKLLGLKIYPSQQV